MKGGALQTQMGTRNCFGPDEEDVVKRTSNKRLTIESERVRNLVVELSPAELRRVIAAGTRGTDKTTTTTQEAPPSTRLC